MSGHQREPMWWAIPFLCVFCLVSVGGALAYRAIWHDEMGEWAWRANAAVLVLYAVLGVWAWRSR